MEISKKAITTISLVTLVSGIAGSQADADETQTTTIINWQRLQLSPSQSQVISTLEMQWNHDYMELQPSILDDQRKLTRLLADPKSDPLEIMAMQQNIARRREQLRSTATANYLRKRQILNDSQQHTLEDMVRQAVAERQRNMNPSSGIEAMPARVQGLMRKIQGIFPGNQAGE